MERNDKNKDLRKEAEAAQGESGSQNYRFYSHKECEYFPCHKTGKPEDFNCLFCYCPLYALKDRCGGNFKYTEKGIKDCSQCMVPHKRENYQYIMGKFKEIIEITKKD